MMLRRFLLVSSIVVTGAVAELHAAADTTGKWKVPETPSPSATPEEPLPPGLPPAATDERRAVLQLMKANRLKYGDDVALFQGLLLTHSLEGEAIFTAESKILGFEEREGRKYVAFHLASGVVLNDKLLGREQRLERIWHLVLERTLLRYPTFTTPADGLAVEIEYSHRAYNHVSDLSAGDDAGAVERAKFYMLSPDLTEFLAYRLGPQAFLDRSRILLDDGPIALRLTEVMQPPRPPRTVENKSSKSK